MPAEAAAQADIDIEQAKAQKQKEADVNQFFSFLGLGGTSWQDVGVYLALTLLLVFGIIGLLSAAKGG